MHSFVIVIRHISLSKLLTDIVQNMPQKASVGNFQVPALQRITSTPGHDPSPHCLRLVDHFSLPGKGSAGRHICLVTPLFGGDITRYARTSNLLRYPLPLAKRILLHTLRALNDLHECGVVHTDIKSDNIFFDTPLENEDIRVLLESNPSRRHQAEASYDGIVHAAVSQPLPLPTIEKFTKRTFVLGDLGSGQFLSPLSAPIARIFKICLSLSLAQPIGQRITDHICPESLRPPEIYIGGPWNEKVDIWSFGCLVRLRYDYDSVCIYFVHAECESLPRCMRSSRACRSSIPRKEVLTVSISIRRKSCSFR